MLRLAHGPACRHPCRQGAFPISRQTMRQSVLVIDDQTSNSLLIAEILSGISASVAVLTFDQPLEAVKYAADHHLDLVVTDFSMPDLDGIGVIRLLKQMNHLADLPIVVVTACDDLAVRYAALDAGAADFLIRPINPRECQSRCRNLLNMRSFQLQNKRHAEILEQRVAEVTEDLQSRNMEMLQRLAVDVLHDDVLHTVVETHIVNGHNPRMIETGDHACLLDETGDGFLRVESLGARNLQRHQAVQLRVARQIDSRECSGTEVIDDLEATEELWNQRDFGGLV